MKDKTRKYRGLTTHGRGSMKKGRGRGEKGGGGFGGTKHKHLKYRWGSHGFKFHGIAHKKKAINVGDLIKFEDKEVNLKEMGYDKLLGSGIINRPMKVIVPFATEKAVKKIKAAGGEVITD
ncbi:MAG: uL15m family ribosomal protein [Candidatus Thermoplasmatota archaeon]|nr:uL15m family ribosomal protein [Candidatus Thermoplasmatota archaeon]